MRLPLIAPADLTPQQKSLYDDMRKGITSNFNAFKVLSENGALMGPWNPWLHEPGIGKAIWDLTLAMTANAILPDNVRQISSWWLALDQRRPRPRPNHLLDAMTASNHRPGATPQTTPHDASNRLNPMGCEAV
jgi:hypothetical protein